MAQESRERVKIVLTWLHILDDLEPFFDERCEFRCAAKVMDDVNERLEIEIAGEEADLAGNDEIPAYRRAFEGRPSGWLGLHAPDDEEDDLENMDNWRVHYGIVRVRPSCPVSPPGTVPAPDPTGCRRPQRATAALPA